MKKICFKCNIEKEISEYYKHPKMKDGHLNKCKQCNKKDSISNYNIKSNDTEFVESERIRQREKYKRLNYLEKQKKSNVNKPWTSSSKYKNLRRKFKCDSTIELHHWCYREEYLEDVIFLNKNIHKRIHKTMVLDMDNFIFKTLNGVPLDSKEKHLNHIEKFLNT